MTNNQTLDILLDVYAYNHAFRIAKTLPNIPKTALYLLEMLKERRELNLAFLAEHAAENRTIEDQYHCSLWLNQSLEDEQIANYILDLEVKVKNGAIIDFVRSVSPILYRLFRRLITSEIPNFKAYIFDTKNDQYDTWHFQAMLESDHEVFKAYLSQKQSRNVTTKSLADMLTLTSLPREIKDLVFLLRHFEKAVRNPLAHLIKPFDEEELHRTTHFSSQAFLENIITLATFSGVIYRCEPFYFDDMNAIIKKELSLWRQSIV
ncbi:TPA: LytR family transcriptional regulator [Streptococcus pyogenes]|uniref:LytR family transcriptional regulator n=1 Tax=Streptococcus pyogenes TaxID=1314 RepID=UPI00109D07C4|nr:LytR family transcriptional regulator [Streptococcus pyogenes]VGR09075.1 LytR family transcriptional regulator [Streptococcus pyogenes]VGV45158.1 histidine protein kinase [Streptococcus pyogenes]VGZ87438.1 histidine protein kinase [Streptococcus pyogenes]VHA08932.1 histidine protein kinase [Streptococcus pyogenes]VHC08095.1 histidine protein kinase [Streptococcus pyogenes]